MKRNLTLFCSLFIVASMLALSYQAVLGYGNRTVNRAFPMKTIEYSIGTEKGQADNIADILLVMQTGTHKTETTLSMDELATFATMERVEKQLTALYDNAVLPADNYEIARPALLNKFSKNGYADAYLWNFVFHNGKETLAIMYHPVMDKVLNLEITETEYYSPERLTEVRGEFLSYIATAEEQNAVGAFAQISTGNVLIYATLK